MPAGKLQDFHDAVERQTRYCRNRYGAGAIMTQRICAAWNPQRLQLGPDLQVN